MSKITIKKNELDIVSKLLKQYLPNHQIFAFGSRVTGKAKPFSDLDLIVLTETPIPVLTMYNVKTAFDESTLPFKIDLLDSTTISDEFRKMIEKEWVVFHCI